MLNAFIKGQELKIVGSLVVSDTIDYLEAAFIFQTADWTGLSKWAHFTLGEKTYDIMLTDDKIRREDHLNLSAGEWKVYLHGVSADGMRITTAEQKITVQNTGVLNGQPLPDVPPTPAEQIAAQAKRAEDKATEALTEVKKVVPLAEAAKASAEAAAKSEKNARQSEQLASVQVDEASYQAFLSQESANEAKNSAHEAEKASAEIYQERIKVNQLVTDAREIAKGINLDVVKNTETASQISKDAQAVSQDKAVVVNAKAEAVQAKDRVEALEKSTQTAKGQAEASAVSAKASEEAVNAKAVEIKADTDRFDGLLKRSKKVSADLNKNIIAAGGLADRVEKDAAQVAQDKQTVMEAKQSIEGSIGSASESARKAKASEDNAKKSEAVVSDFAKSASENATKADTARAEAEKSAVASATSASEASDSATTAQTQAQEATKQVGLAKVEVTKATEQATKATQEADRAKTEADRSIAMGLTGMKVGDRVVVASVDENGVPTGWKPEGKWELIETIKGAGAAIVRRNEPDGTGYRFKSLILEVQTGETGIDTTGNYNAFTNKGAYSARLERDAGGNKVYAARFLRNNRFLEPSIILPVEVTHEYVYTGEVKINPHMIEDNTPIFTMSTSAYLPIGATMKIWAVRA